MVIEMVTHIIIIDYELFDAKERGASIVGIDFEGSIGFGVMIDEFKCIRSATKGIESSKEEACCYFAVVRRHCDEDGYRRMLRLRGIECSCNECNCLDCRFDEEHCECRCDSK